MNVDILERRFSEIGARVKVLPPAQPRWSPRLRRVQSPARLRAESVRLNVLRDSRGEHFTVAGPAEARVEVVDVQSKDRHLLLLTAGCAGNQE